MFRFLESLPEPWFGRACTAYFLFLSVFSTVCVMAGYWFFLPLPFLGAILFGLHAADRRDAA